MPPTVQTLNTELVVDRDNKARVPANGHRNTVLGETSNARSGVGVEDRGSGIHESSPTSDTQCEEAPTRDIRRLIGRRSRCCPQKPRRRTASLPNSKSTVRPSAEETTLSRRILVCKLTKLHRGRTCGPHVDCMPALRRRNRDGLRQARCHTLGWLDAKH